MPFPALAATVAEVQRLIAAAVGRGGRGQRVEIVAVTKTYGPDAVEAAATAGLWSVGENKVQEALDKMPLVRAPVRWHMIGHLQRNKVKFVDAFVLVHSMDRPALADALHAHGMHRGRPVDVLVQVSVAGEATKGGYPAADVAAEAARLKGMGGLAVRGVMTMAPFDAPESVLRSTFAGARNARDVLVAAGHPAVELSMGMSGDFEVAVEEGATMVRLGTVLFGARH